MPRLIRVRTLCDFCRAAEAIIYCAQHRGNQCPKCERTNHQDASAADHSQVPVTGVLTALTMCQRCDHAPASLYCLGPCGAICSSCSEKIISTSTESHKHKALEDVLDKRNITFTGREKEPENSSYYFAHGSKQLNPSGSRSTAVVASDASKCLNITGIEGGSTSIPNDSESPVDAPQRQTSSVQPASSRERYKDRQNEHTAKRQKYSPTRQRSETKQQSASRTATGSEQTPDAPFPDASTASKDEQEPEATDMATIEQQTIERLWPSDNVFFQDPEDMY